MVTTHQQELIPVLLTTAEAASTLQVNRMTVARWVQSGRITPLRTVGKGGYVFTADEVARVAALSRPRRGRRAS